MSFPQHTSPLTFEPLSPSPSEILVRDSEDDDDIDQRAAKRRRVEKLGQQYLKGRPLLISTARLRGPFNAGWVNPWRRAKSRDPEPETAKKHWDRRAREDWQKQEVRREAEKIRGKVEIFPSSIYVARRAVLKVPQAAEPAGVLQRKVAQTVNAPNPFPKDIVALQEAKAERRARRHYQEERRKQSAKALQKDGLGRGLGHLVDTKTDESKTHAKHGVSRSNVELRPENAVNSRSLQNPVQKRTITPTPASQIPHTPPTQKAPSPQPQCSPPSQAVVLDAGQNANAFGENHTSFGSSFGFTPVNKPRTSIPVTSPTHDASRTAEPPVDPAIPASAYEQYFGMVAVGDITLAEAEADVIEGFKQAQALAWEAALEANSSLQRSSLVNGTERCVTDIIDGSLASERQSQDENSQANTPQEIEGSQRAEQLAQAAVSEANPPVRRSSVIGYAERCVSGGSHRLRRQSSSNITQTIAPEEVSRIQSPPVSNSARRLLVAVEIPKPMEPRTFSPAEGYGSFRELPPSTNLPAFEYRRAATATREPLKTGDANGKVSFKEDIRKKPKVMTFASSPCSENPAAALPLTPPKSHAQPADENSRIVESDTTANHEASWDLVERYTNKIITKATFDNENGSQQPVGEQIRDIFRQSASSLRKQQCNSHQEPTAIPIDLPNQSNSKFNDQPPSPTAALPNSTNDHPRLPEAKESRNESADNYFSTQAAIAQAQRSFQADISSPVKQPSPPLQPINEAAPSLNTTTFSQEPLVLGATPSFPNFKTPPPANPTLPKLTDEEDPLSTQELMNNLSPFTFSTNQKYPTRKPRASFAPSPLDIPIMSGDINADEGDTTTFTNLNLDMSTSPEPLPSHTPKIKNSVPRKSALKKPPKPPRQPSSSSQRGTSFSITPDGVLKEVYSNQDGQGGRVDDRELDAMIDDVGSFLETWDVETEMKRCGNAVTQTPSISNGKEKGLGKRALFSWEKV